MIEEPKHSCSFAISFAAHIHVVKKTKMYNSSLPRLFYIRSNLGLSHYSKTRNLQNTDRSHFNVSVYAVSFINTLWFHYNLKGLPF